MSKGQVASRYDSKDDLSEIDALASADPDDIRDFIEKLGFSREDVAAAIKENDIFLNRGPFESSASDYASRYKHASTYKSNNGRKTTIFPMGQQIGSKNNGGVPLPADATADFKGRSSIHDYVKRERTGGPPAKPSPFSSTVRARPDTGDRAPTLPFADAAKSAVAQSTSKSQRHDGKKGNESMVTVSLKGVVKKSPKPHPMLTNVDLEKLASATPSKITRAALYSDSESEKDLMTQRVKASNNAARSVTFTEYSAKSPLRVTSGAHKVFSRPDAGRWCPELSDPECVKTGVANPFRKSNLSKSVYAPAPTEQEWDMVTKTEAGKDEWLAVDVDKTTAKIKFSTPDV